MRCRPRYTGGVDETETRTAAQAGDAALSPEEREARRKRMLENFARAAEAEGPKARALEWRGATPERHAEVLGQVLNLVEVIRRSRGIRVWDRRPLPFVRLKGSSLPSHRNE